MGTQQSKEDIVINSNAGEVQNSVSATPENLTLHEITTITIVVILIGLFAVFVGKICKKWLDKKIVREIGRSQSQEAV